MKNLLTAILMTVVTTVLLGLVYPLANHWTAQLVFPYKANGQLIKRADRYGDWLTHNPGSHSRLRLLPFKTERCGRRWLRCRASSG